jgi:catechol 2,3-dioxygenase-like lactoylglutathione lyase family enzyme
MEGQPRRTAVIIGAHTLIYTDEPEAMRAFFRDVLGLPYVDAGRDWLIFTSPPAELAVHPAGPGGYRHELTLMCDDIAATVAELTAKGVEFTSEVTDQHWGLLTSFRVPGGGEMGLYEPRHPTAMNGV